MAVLHPHIVVMISIISYFCFRTWRLKDICFSPSIPNFDVHYIDQVSVYVLYISYSEVNNYEGVLVSP